MQNPNTPQNMLNAEIFFDWEYNLIPHDKLSDTNTANINLVSKKTSILLALLRHKLI
jgi:hypothetical protein